MSQDVPPGLPLRWTDGSAPAEVLNAALACDGAILWVGADRVEIELSARPTELVSKSDVLAVVARFLGILLGLCFGLPVLLFECASDRLRWNGATIMCVGALAGAAGLIAVSKVITWKTRVRLAHPEIVRVAFHAGQLRVGIAGDRRVSSMFELSVYRQGGAEYGPIIHELVMSLQRPDTRARERWPLVASGSESAVRTLKTYIESLTRRVAS